MGGAVVGAGEDPGVPSPAWGMPADDYVDFQPLGTQPLPEAGGFSLPRLDSRPALLGEEAGSVDNAVLRGLPGQYNGAIQSSRAAAGAGAPQASVKPVAPSPPQTTWGDYLTHDLLRDLADVPGKLAGYGTVAGDWFTNSPGGNVQARLVQQYLSDPSKLSAETRAAVAPMAKAYQERQAAFQADLAPLRQILSEEAQRRALETPVQRLISGVLDSAPDLMVAAGGQVLGVPAPVSFGALQGLRGYADSRAQGLSEDESLGYGLTGLAANGLMFPIAEATGGAAGTLTSKLVGGAAGRLVGDPLGAALGQRAGQYVQGGTTMAALGAASGGANEAYDEYLAGRIDYANLAAKVGDQAAQGFVAGLVPVAGSHAVGAVRAGLDSAVNSAAARSPWKEMTAGGAADTQSPAPKPADGAPGAPRGLQGPSGSAPDIQIPLRRGMADEGQDAASAPQQPGEEVRGLVPPEAERPPPVGDAAVDNAPPSEGRVVSGAEDDGADEHDTSGEGGAGSRRIEYVGATPTKYSRTGREVVERMRKEGRIQGEGPLLRGNPNNLRVLGSDKNWHLIDETIDMAHIVDAVSWWNRTGRFFGAKAPEVRNFMLDSNNYKLEPRSLNRSAGAKLGRTEKYLPPVEPPLSIPGSENSHD